tara:strand:- start:3772 stop:4194 length:423 start_codon:yes stop_codon:yes gene_type:complete
MNSKFNPVAGIVILKVMDGDYSVLCLETKHGDYDLTKGHLHPDEDPMTAALREAKEEADITEISFPFGKDTLSVDACEMFVGVTEQIPEIRANPYTGICEHKKIVWLPIVDAVNSNKIKTFLHPAVMFAYEKVIESRKNE